VRHSGPNARDDGGKLLHHVTRFEAQHLVAEPAKLLIPPRIGAPPALMSAAIHFDHEPKSRRMEIRDEWRAHRHLPAKHYAETTRRKLPPEPGFR